MKDLGLVGRTTVLERCRKQLFRTAREGVRRGVARGVGIRVRRQTGRVVLALRYPQIRGEMW